jgi:A118 family predicted phage portal protein
LAEAAEVCAALGGVYLRAGWDFGSKQVFCSRVDADAAQPVFVWGRLVQVTFWHQLSEPDSRRVLRHLETHGLDEQGIGVIRHQLFEGTVDTLGTLVPLLDHPATSGLPVSELIDGDTISTGVPGLDVVYVPNVTPNPLWRNNITGSSLGAADICQAEDLLDRLDFVYSSLMRELDLARARIVVPEAWLTTHGPGRGQAFDIDREVFTGVNAPPADQVKAELLQPLIRVEEHLRTMQQITEDVLRRSGYSAATFGEDEDGAATATEVNSKNSRSRLTRQRKIRHWQPAVERLVQQMMRIDVALGLKYGPTSGFARGVDPELVMVTFPSPAMSSTELAGMVAAWAQAEAASIEIRVRTIHPDWDDTEVNDEVARIKEERGAALPDPGTFGQGGFGISDGLDGLSGQQGGPTPVLAAPAAPVAIGTA